MRRGAWGTLVGMLAPAVLALVLWVLAAPRSELLSVGGGRGVRIGDEGAAGGAQLLMLAILLGFAAACSALVLWHRHPGLRRPSGVPALVLLPGLVCAVVAALASPAAALLASPPSDSEAGQVVAQAPAAGELFFGRMIYGVSGPEWGLFPPGTGWLVWGTMIAAFTVAALAHFSPSRQLGDEPVAGPDQAAAAAD
ncbi:MAG TPA: hypothetical protein H9759_07825 [Candidatus Dietzia intestinipullorum]|nr:hypothetical protein [Candidatus Dietzia intestinipullorum]